MRMVVLDESRVQVHAGVGVEDSDFVLPRLRGVSPMTGTQVDSLLRNIGVTTIVGTGVSVNWRCWALRSRR